MTTHDPVAPRPAPPATEVRVGRDGPVLTLTLDGPATRNALGADVYAALGAAITAASGDPEIGAIVLTGVGGHFCSGGNIHALRANRQRTPAEQRARIELLHGLIRAVKASPKPVVAAVEGAASGAGFSLALACDLLVAAEDARFSMAYVKIGLTPDGGGTASLARMLPPQLATEAALLGEPIGAARLHALGVVNRLTPPGSAVASAHELAHRLANGPAEAIARAKTLLAGAADVPFETQLDREADAFVTSLFAEEAGEGLAAFLAKRPPVFRRPS